MLKDTKILYFVRHGQSSHNLSLEEKKLSGDEVLTMYATKFRDSRLSDRGIQEARSLYEEILKRPKIMTPELICVSPCSRTLKTASLVFQNHLKKKTFLVVEELRERHGRFPCEQRRNRSIVSKEYPYFDFSQISEKDMLWRLNREPRQNSIDRANKFLKFISSRNEKIIACVSHAGFMGQSLFTDKNKKITIMDKEKMLHGFENCEMRIMEFKIFNNDTYSVKMLDSIKRPKVDNDDEEEDIKAKNLGRLNMAELYKFSGKEIEEKLKIIRKENPLPYIKNPEDHDFNLTAKL
jgi:broad specificity phosphatase PhoE